MIRSGADKSKKGFDFPKVENIALRHARKDLIALQRKVAALHFEIASRVSDLKAAVGAEKLAGALVAECSVPPDLVGTYVGIAEHLLDHKQILVEKCASISVMKDLVYADEHARSVTLRRLASNSMVTTGDAASLAQATRKASAPPEVEEARARRRYLSGVASRVTVRPAIESFEASVRDLAEKVSAFRSRNLQLMHASFKGYDRIRSSAPAYREGHQAIRTKAEPVLLEFERIYGGKHIAQERWRELAVRRPHAVRLAMAHKALARLASGRFGHDGGFTFDPTDRSLGRNDMLHSLQYLSEARLPLPYGTLPASFKDSSTKVLELCAGVGGQALGLQAAGLEVVAAFENWQPAAKALKSNRPGMNVITQDIAGDPEKLFAPFAGRIDIISGGLPCQPYSGRGDGEGQFDPRDLFPTAVRIVRTVKPKAFFFENVEGFTYFRHGSHRAEIVSDLTAAGYEVRIERVNSKHFGVPQDRERVLIIGMKPEIARRFEMPSSQDRSVSMGEALKELLFPHRTRSGVQTLAPSPDQKKYDQWFEWWMTEFGSGFAPTVTRIGQSAEYTSSWTKRGIDPSGLADRPPSLGDVHVGYLPRLTIQMVKRIQGLPSDWRLGSSKNAASQQLANAFPPQVARAIGLSLRQALTGQKLDVGRLMREPITGRRRRLSDRPAPVVPQADD